MFKEKGSLISKGLSTGISGGKTTVTNSFSSIITALKNGANTSITQGTYETYAKRIPNGLQSGIGSGKNTVNNAMSTIINTIKTTASNGTADSIKRHWALTGGV